MVWTPNRRRAVRTKREDARKMRAWKRWQERRGWTTRTVNGGEAVLAKPVDAFESRAAIILWEFGPTGRIYPKPPRLNDPYSGIGFEKTKERKPSLRQGRKPAGV